MAEMEIELNLGPILRKALVNGFADMLTANPQYTLAVVLEIMKRDAIVRSIIAEAFGEADREYHAGASWDEIALKEISTLQDTPGGRGEAV